MVDESGTETADRVARYQTDDSSSRQNLSMLLVPQFAAAAWRVPFVFFFVLRFAC